MKKRTERKTDEPKSSTFLTFWTTLPGILTGVAALITAIVGLYVTFGPRNNNSNNATNAVKTSTPQASATAQAIDGNCFENEFADTEDVEVGVRDRHIASKDGVTRMRLTDNHVVVGALKLRFYRVGEYFEVEQAVDLKCKPVKVRNASLQTPVDENHKPKNYNNLEIQLGGQTYLIALGFDAVSCTAYLRKV